MNKNILGQGGKMNLYFANWDGKPFYVITEKVIKETTIIITEGKR